MTLSHFLAVLRARWRFALAVLLVTVSTAAAAALLMPRSFTATAALLIDVSRPDPVTGQSNGGNPSPAILSTQLGVLRSERVALEVVRELGLASQPKARADWLAATQGQGDIAGWLATRLQKTVEITPERDSNVVAISARAPDAAQAARVANAFAQAYLSVSAAVRAEVAQGATSFFVQRAGELRAKFEQAQSRLAAYQRDKGVVVGDERLNSEVARLNELDTQLTLSQAAAAESAGRRAFASQGGADQLPDAQASPVLGGLRVDLVRAELQLQELTARLNDAHPQVIQARNTVALLRNRLDAETRRVGGSLNAVNSAQRQREAELRGAVEAQRARVLRLKTVQGDGQMLLRDVENAQRAYNDVQAKLNQASLESHALQGNATLLAPAIEPGTPSSPRRLVTVGLAAALALLLAAVAVVLMEVADPRLRTDEMAVTLLEQSLLGVVPRPDGGGALPARKRPLVEPGWPRRLAPPAKGA